MLYGRRVTYSEKQFGAVGTLKKHTYLRKNILAVGVITAIVSSLFFIPTYHFVSENFKIFMSLAFEYQPSLVQHLERELSWIQLFFGSAIAGFTAFTSFYFYQSLRGALSPLEKMCQHIEGLKKGMYHSEEMTCQANELTALTGLYSEFHRSLKNQTEEELALLKRIPVDPNNKDALIALKKLISLKEEQLGVAALNENVVNLSEYDRQRRAS